MCDQNLRTLALSKRHFDATHLSYLSNAPNGDGDIFYGPINPTSNLNFQIEVLFVVKLSADHGVTELLPGQQNVHGLNSSYRTSAQNIQISCAEKKIFAPAIEYYDKDEHLVYLSTALSVQPLDIKSGSIFGSLLDVVCSAATPSQAGYYEGINNTTYEKGGQSEQKITISVQQIGGDLKVRFQTAVGGQGEGMGTLSGNRIESISLHSTVPECPGSYDGSLSFAENSVTWSYKGQDCAGPMKGHGTAKKVSR